MRRIFKGLDFDSVCDILAHDYPELVAARRDFWRGMPNGRLDREEIDDSVFVFGWWIWDGITVYGLTDQPVMSDYNPATTCFPEIADAGYFDRIARLIGQEIRRDPSDFFNFRVLRDRLEEIGIQPDSVEMIDRIWAWLVSDEAEFTEVAHA